MRLSCAAALAAVALAGPARAYHETLHVFLTTRALERAAWRAEEVRPPTAADLAALRALFWEAASQLIGQAISLIGMQSATSS